MEHMISVAVFDPEDSTTVKSVAEALREYEAILIECQSEEELRVAIGQPPLVDVVVLNLERPLGRSFSQLSEIQTKAPEAEVIFVALFDDEKLWAWMEVIQRGAYEFLPKPFDREDLERYVVQAVEKRRLVERRRQ